MPNTRVETKSRPHKRPQGVDALGDWVWGRRPRQDFKSYPATGYGPEVMGAATGPDGPAGTVPLAGQYIRVGAANPAVGGLYLAYPELQVNETSLGGGDNTIGLAALNTGDTLYFTNADGSGTNTLTIGSNDGVGGGVREFTCSAEVPVGTVEVGEVIYVWVTIPASDIGEYDPGDHTVGEVQVHVTTNHLGGNPTGDPVTPADLVEIQRILDEERAGLNRSTLVAWLDGIQGVV